MATNIAIEIEGLKEMQAGFNKSPAAFVRSFDPAVKAASFVLLSGGRQWAPVDKDFLRGTMEATFEVLVGRVESKAPYDIYVHEGTKKMAARPFYDQAIEGGQAEVDEIFSKAMDDFNNSI